MKHRRRYIILSTLLVLLISALVVIQYYHFTGLQDSLERLVVEKTKGEYKLDMGKTKYDFFRLKFILKDARIYRIDTLNQKRMYSVEFPEVIINLGSLQSYFSFGQIYVKEFVIKEPMVILQKENTKKQKLNLSNELAQLLRMIKEVLDSFNIRSFKIIKGSFKLSKGDQELRMSLIDFLAQEWNVRRLTKRSQIKIDIGGQELNIFKHSFQFAQIEYSYQKRQMKISDFRYFHKDSVTGTRMEATGGALVIDHMDWEKLYSSDRYKFQKIELTDVNFKGSFPPGNRKKKRGVNFSRVVYETLGEFLIDSLLVSNADVDLTYKRRNDSSSVSLKGASFSLLDLKMIGTDESFEVGQVRFNLNKTTLGFGKDYLIGFDSLLYNANKTAHRRPEWIVGGVEVTDRATGTNFLQCGVVVVTDFDPFDFLLHKKVRAEALELRDVSLDLSPERMRRRHADSTGKSTPDINIDHLMLRRGNISYHSGNHLVDIKGLNLSMHDIHLIHHHKPVYEFEWLDMDHLTYSDSTHTSKVDARLVYVDPHKVISKSIVGEQTGRLTVRLNNVEAVYSYDSLLAGFPISVGSLYMSGLSISGHYVSRGAKTRLPICAIRHVRVDTATIAVQANDALAQISASGFRLTGLRSDSLQVHWDAIQTRIHSFSFKDREMLLTGKQSVINSNGVSRIGDVAFVTMDSTILFRTDIVKIQPFDERAYLANVAVINANVRLVRDNVEGAALLDSVVLGDVRVQPKLAMETIHVYHPMASLTIMPRGQRVVRSAASRSQIVDFAKAISVSHGRFDVDADNSRYLIYDVNADWKGEDSYSYNIDSLTTVGKHYAFSVHKIGYRQNQYDVGSLRITPLESIRDYSATGVQRDWLQFNFEHLTLKGFLVDSLLKSKKIQMDEMSIGAFRVDAMRDKRLPEAPFREKALFSRRLYTTERVIDIPVLHLDNGIVNVMQISGKTEDMGTLEIDHISGDIRNIHSVFHPDKKLQLDVKAQIDGNGMIDLKYAMEEIDRFSIDATISDLDLSAFNSMIQPLQSVRFKSGRLKSLRVKAEAANSSATGEAMINYKDLRIEILKKERAVFGNEVLSLLANQLIKNNRRDVGAPLVQERDRAKSEFSYWVKIVLKGASDAARHGKKKKRWK